MSAGECSGGDRDDHGENGVLMSYLRALWLYTHSNGLSLHQPFHCFMDYDTGSSPQSSYNTARRLLAYCVVYVRHTSRGAEYRKVHVPAQNAAVVSAGVASGLPAIRVEAALRAGSRPAVSTICDDEWALLLLPYLVPSPFVNTCQHIGSAHGTRRYEAPGVGLRTPRTLHLGHLGAATYITSPALRALQ